MIFKPRPSHDGRNADPDSRGRWAAQLGVLAALYFITAKIGLSLAVVNPSASTVWPPAGIALAAVLVYGMRVWPAIAVGAFFANLTTAGTPLTSLAIAGGNTLEAVFGAFLIERFAGGRYALDSVPGIFKFVGLGAMVSALIAATIGVTTLTAAGFADVYNYRAIWYTWWLGDAVGDIIVGGLLLHWFNHPRPSWPKRPLEAALAVVFFVATAVLYFGGVGTANAPIGWYWIPVMLYVSYRFGQRAAATMVFGLATLTILGTIRGFGPFALPSRSASLLLLQAFLGVTAVSSLILASVMKSQREAMAGLRDARDQLEDRVRERTEAHSRLYESLKGEIGERLRLQKELVDAGETERLRLGRDLHDDLGQLLTGILFLSGALEKKLGDGKEAKAVAEIRNLVQEAITKTRMLSLGLTPVSLGTGGLRTAVQELANMTERVFDVECRVEYPGDLIVERPVAATNLYRIVQEAISNAVRHGGCRRIEIALRLESGRLVLVIRDDGAGISDTRGDRTGLGLNIMKYRVEVLGGTMDIRSDSQGTTVTCVVPGAGRREPVHSTDPPV